MRSNVSDYVALGVHVEADNISNSECIMRAAKSDREKRSRFRYDDIRWKAVSAEREGSGGGCYCNSADKRFKEVPALHNGVPIIA